MKTVAGLVETRSQARDTLDDLRLAGFDPAQLSLLVRPSGPPGQPTRQDGHTLPLGAVVGRNAGWLAGAGALAVPGLGPVVAVGPVAAALGMRPEASSPDARGCWPALGLAAALKPSGFVDGEVRQFEAGLVQGDILVTVSAGDERAAGRAADILRQNGAKRVASAG